jgi:hypothetical protein
MFDDLIVKRRKLKAKWKFESIKELKEDLKTYKKKLIVQTNRAPIDTTLLYFWKKGIVYMPYIPLLKTPLIKKLEVT